MLPPIIETKRFILKPYSTEDEDAIIEIALDPESVKFMGGSNGIEAEERAMFKKVFPIYNNTESKRWFWLWGVYDKIDGKLLAHLELKNETDNTEGNELEVIYMVHPNARKKGVMTEVLTALQAQQTTWERKIIATVSFKNEASRALLAKCGISKQTTVKDKETDYEYLKIWLK